jgi:hypothetical protein
LKREIERAKVLQRRYVMRRIVLVFVGCCLLAGPAWAGGGFSLFGAYSEITDSGRSIGAGARLSLGGESVLFDLTATAFFQDVNTGHLGLPGTSDVSIAPIEIGGRYLFGRGRDFRPYLGLGASYLLVDVSGGDADDEFGAYGLVGLVFGANGKVQLYGEMVYRYSEITVDYGAYGKSEVEICGFGIAAGFNFTF